jgi:Domain of unknown function (DUF4124)
MHLRKSWLVVGALATVFAAQAGAIYKWTDADGVVHYSDQEAPGSERIYTTSTNISSSKSAAAKPGAAVPQRNIASALAYSEFSITSPKSDETFFGDNPVGVNLLLVPGLRSGQNITWHLNGKQVDEAGNSTSFVLPRLDRGSYVLAATITDAQSGESQTTNSINFFVRQPVGQGPQHK